MKTRTKVITAATLTLVGGVAIVGGVAVANTDDDATERPITGAALDQASQVALEHLGEGRVTGTEEGDEDSYYEVEVTRDDGSQVDVQLDRDFNVVSADADSETDG
jgi:uncharacterized membrane protein YkoI